MPAIGIAGCSAGKTKNATTPSTSRIATPRAATGFLGGAFIGSSSKERPGHKRCQRAVNQCERPQADPVAEDVAETRVHLVDAHQSVERRRARKDEGNVMKQRRDRLDRPGDSDEEEQRQADGNEQKDRGL